MRSLGPLPSGLVRCLGAPVSADQALLDVWRPFVASEEIARIQKFARLEDAVSHLAGRALVRLALEVMCGRAVLSPFAQTSWGQPLYPPFCFSISHAQNMVWVALCRDAAVGIDVESVQPVAELAELMLRLHPQERAYLRSLPEDALLAAYFRCWTRKEAVLKALGRGLSLPLDSFAVHAGPRATDWLLSLPAVPRSEKGSRQCGAYMATASLCAQWWTCAQIQVGADHCCHVAAAAPGLAVQAVFIQKPFVNPTLQGENALDGRRSRWQPSS